MLNFTGAGLPLTDHGLEQIRLTLNVDLPAIWALVSVETQGFGFFPDRRPQILFERHIFHRLTQGAFAQSHPDICASTAGGYRGGTNEYSRLETALRLNQDAALQSASWGIGQVMGFNFALAGFDSVQDMVQEMVRDENRQLRAMADFIRASQLAGALMTHDWPAFARGYNGPGYETHQYPARLAEAFTRARLNPPDLTLRSAQAALLYLGLSPGPIDGLRGPRTSNALMRFQQSNGLTGSGELDKETRSALQQAAFPGSVTQP